MQIKKVATTMYQKADTLSSRKDSGRNQNPNRIFPLNSNPNPKNMSQYP